tara:strand:+ start:997 stop:1200 length:204 start_codon:yes stop_codon:yes gene_type:complete
MSNFFFGLLIAAMLATLGALIIGLFAFARGGEFNEKHGNRLMRLRVFLQGLALVLFIAAIVTSQSGE